MTKAGSFYTVWTKRKWTGEEFTGERKQPWELQLIRTSKQDLDWGRKWRKSNEGSLYNLLGCKFPISGDVEVSTSWYREIFTRLISCLQGDRGRSKCPHCTDCNLSNFYLKQSVWQSVTFRAACSWSLHPVTLPHPKQLNCSRLWFTLWDVKMFGFWKMHSDKYPAVMYCVEYFNIPRSQPQSFSPLCSFPFSRMSYKV